jgi:DNA-binding transcriptional regulator YiaG
MNSLRKLIALQKKEDYTNHEMAIMLEIPENTWETWKSGIRTPRGPSLTIIKWALLTLQGNPITRQQLLAATGRIGGLTPKTLKEIRGLE